MVKLEQKFVRVVELNKIKILHCADIHIDTPFKDLPENLADKRKEEIKDTFINIIDLCKKERIQILLIAGDVFDNLRVYKNSLELLKNKFNEIKHIRVFIAAGNHDPYNKKSFYELIDWPTNVHIFKNDIEEIFLKDLNTVVCGFSFKDNYIRERKLKDYTIPDIYSNSIKIMVCHGVITTEKVANSGEIQYNPITEVDIKTLSVDYLALGHTHRFSGINRLEKTAYSYSGCPEGRGFDELGDKGVILGEIGNNYVDLKFKSICKRRYIEKEISVDGCSCHEDLAKKILQEVEKYDKGFSKNIYKFILVGNVNDNFVIQESLLKKKIKNNFFFIKVKDKTSLKIDYYKAAKEYSLKGIFISKMLEKLKNATEEKEKEILNYALKIGVESLLQDEVNLDDN